MFKKLASACLLSSAAYSAQAVETLDVVVLYDTNTINQVSALNTTEERIDYAATLIKRMNESFSNSLIGNYIQFNLRKQLLATISNEDGSGPEDINAMVDRYKGYISTMKATGNPVGKAHIIQDMFNADVVAVVTYTGVTDSCGKAVTIPTTKGLYNEQAIKEHVEFGPTGLFFLNSHNMCLEDITLPAHEFGHTAGLWHGQYTDSTMNYAANIEPYMLREGAVGYNYMPWYALNFKTLMARYPLSDKLYNRFSNKNRYDCNGSNACGNTDANAVATLKAYAASYNKRGSWFDEN